jgi:hypothetical protein
LVSRPRRIRRRGAPGERREIGDAARIAGLGGALEQFARLRLVLRNAGTAAVEYAEFDHRRGRALVGGLAPGSDRFRGLLVGGVGAAELVQRPPRRARGNLAIFDRGRDIRGRDVSDAPDVGGLVGIGGVGGEPVAQHEVGRLRLHLRWIGPRCGRRDRDRRHGGATCGNR